MNTETTYICCGFSPVKAGSNKEAASIFASRAAHNRFGRTGYCSWVKANSQSKDGRFVEYEAFIGYTPMGRPNATIGNDYRFMVQSS